MNLRQTVKNEQILKRQKKINTSGLKKQNIQKIGKRAQKQSRRKEETKVAGLIGAFPSILEHCLACTSICFTKDSLKRRKGKMEMLMPKESSLCGRRK